MNILTPFQIIQKWLAFSCPFEKKVALTFDDGHKYAEEIFASLEKHGEKASFFLCGSCFNENPDIYKRISDAGHEIGNHSYHHPKMTELTEAEILSELLQTQTIIEEKITCAVQKPKFFRFPYGVDSIPLKRFVEKQGFIPVKWTIDTKDWTGISAVQIYNHILKSTNLVNGAIILMHTSGAHTVESLDLIIPMLRKHRYKMVTISELFQSVPQYRRVFLRVKNMDSDIPRP